MSQQQHPQHDSAPGAPPRFTRDQIEVARQEFGEAADSLRAAGIRTWRTTARTFFDVIREVPVLAHVAAPLRARRYDLNAWMQERRSKSNAGEGGRRQPLALPTDPEQSASFVLQLLEALAAAETDVTTSALLALTGPVGLLGDGLQRLTAELLSVLSPYVARELGTLRRRVPVPPPAGGNAGVVFQGGQHNFGAVIGGSASVTGANFAAGVGGSLTQSAHVPRSDLSREIAGWTDLLGAVEADRHAEVRAAVDALARAADEGGVRPSDLVAAAETVVEAGPTLRERVGGLLRSAGGGAATVLAKKAGTVATTAAATELSAHHDQVVRALEFAWRHLVR